MNDKFHKTIKSAKEIQMTNEEKLQVLYNIKASMVSKPVRTPKLNIISPYLSFFSHFQPKHIVTMAIIVVLAVGASGTSALAQSALPGDALYPIKIHVNEKVESLVAVSAKSHAKVQLKQAERRLVEAEALAKANKLTPEINEQLKNDFKEKTIAMKTDITEISSKGDVALANEIKTNFEDKLDTHIAALTEVSETAEVKTSQATVEQKDETPITTEEPEVKKVEDKSGIKDFVEFVKQERIASADETIDTKKDDDKKSEEGKDDQAPQDTKDSKEGDSKVEENKEIKDDSKKEGQVTPKESYSVEVTSPNEKDEYNAGDTIQVTWKTTGFNEKSEVSMLLCAKDIIGSSKAYSCTSGNEPSPNDGAEEFKIPEYFFGPAFISLSIVETDADRFAPSGNNLTFVKSKPFNIKAVNIPVKTIEVYSPSAGEVYNAGDTINVKWSKGDFPENYEVIIDNSWRTAADPDTRVIGTLNDGTQNMTVYKQHEGLVVKDGTVTVTILDKRGLEVARGQSGIFTVKP